MIYCVCRLMSATNSKTVTNTVTVTDVNTVNSVNTVNTVTVTDVTGVAGYFDSVKPNHDMPNSAKRFFTGIKARERLMTLLSKNVNELYVAAGKMLSLYSAYIIGDYELFSFCSVIPQHIAGRVIGFGGETVNDIRLSSNVHSIQLSRECDHTCSSRLLTVTDSSIYNVIHALLAIAIALNENGFKTEKKECDMSLTLLVQRRIIGCLFGEKSSVMNSIRRKVFGRCQDQTNSDRYYGIAVSDDKLAQFRIVTLVCRNVSQLRNLLYEIIPRLFNCMADFRCRDARVQQNMIQCGNNALIQTQSGSLLNCSLMGRSSMSQSNPIALISTMSTMPPVMSTMPPMVHTVHQAQSTVNPLQSNVHPSQSTSQSTVYPTQSTSQSAVHPSQYQSQSQLQFTLPQYQPYTQGELPILFMNQQPTQFYTQPQVSATQLQSTSNVTSLNILRAMNSNDHHNEKHEAKKEMNAYSTSRLHSAFQTSQPVPTESQQPRLNLQEKTQQVLPSPHQNAHSQRSQQLRQSTMDFHERSITTSISVIRRLLDTLNDAIQSISDKTESRINFHYFNDSQIAVINIIAKTDVNVNAAEQSLLSLL